jgi:two-component system sensor kinase FixL
MSFGNQTALRAYGNTAEHCGIPELRAVVRSSTVMWFTIEQGHGNQGARLGEIKTNWLSPQVVYSQLMEVARLTALAEMASGLAHELNQPLGAIATFAQAGDRLLSRPEPSVARAVDVFRQINQEALAAGDAIKRIRRLFSDELPDGGPCQMPELIAEIRPIIDALALTIQGCVQLDAPATLPDVQADRVRIQHVVLALVQNAVEASAEHSGAAIVQIDVSATRYIVETGVSDSGPGVPADLKDNLFRPFFTTKPKGKGLGLASSRAIVESHEGTMGFDTKSAGGSRVWFRLPISAK